MGADQQLATHEDPGDVPGSFARFEEFERLEALLSRRKAAVALVLGAPGTGKSTLLERLKSAAVEQGWAVPRPLGRDLTIGPATDEQQFGSEISFLLASHATYAGAPPVAAAPAAPRALVDDLAALGPTLLVIDDYRPSAAFAHWFEQTFVSELKGAGIRVVLVIAARPGFDIDADKVSDLVIRLGRLSEQVVRKAIQASAVGLQPSLEAPELEAYVDAARKEPEVFDGLLRLFHLASEATRADERREADG